MFIRHHLGMRGSGGFWDREIEIQEILRRVGRGGFGYVTGRRRIGKTALLVEACRRSGGFYHQAVAGTPQQQLLHMAEEAGRAMPIFKDVVPKSWPEFFGLLAREKLPRLMVFDEFPYWAEGDASVPSVFQKWIDHDLPKFRTLLVVSGSSQSMLYSHFLRRDSPLYGRADLHLALEPMSYAWFCRALHYPPTDPLSFARFSLVGGVPHYWNLMPRGPVLNQAAHLYFTGPAILAEEPSSWIRDEGITGNLPKALLDLIGRGACKPSEMAGRLGTAQGNLSRPLAILLEAGLIRRELPFGESIRTTKRVYYRIEDPALAFYYGTFLPLRSIWNRMSPGDRMAAIHRHAAGTWESFCRSLHPGSGRYWEKGAEIDLVWPEEPGKKYLVAECKWRRIRQADERRLLESLRGRFSNTSLGRKLLKSARVDYKIFSRESLPELFPRG